ncbi:hypothetical protein LIER_32699 [Lithospermum erythrorhizon]|uniref:Protein TIFY n=1 Tax=Lithospermum erythrorhizon TaxID=34254 RepID=A0AAV3S0G0_LITER
MKRNCNLELNHLPPSESFNISNYNNSRHHYMLLDIFNNGNSSSTTMQQEEERQKQMTIFYKGQIAVADVTELQAREIILVANREMEERLSSMNYSCSLPPRTPLVHHPHTPSPTGLSMKRSLQRFLQKRKNRAQAASPYHH